MMWNKKCVKCGRAATHKFVKIDEDQVHDIYYCQDHATEKSPYQKINKIPLSEILANFLSQEQAAQQSVSGDPNLKCDSCGLTFETYHKTLLLGCVDCYEAFHDQLLSELRKFHGNSKHIGRRPGGQKEKGEVIRIAGPPRGESPSKKGGELIEVIDESAAGSEAQVKAQTKTLSEAMEQAIKDEDFEKAATLRDRIKELRALQEKQ